MKVFDFDNTLYRGESLIDFTVFMIKKNKRIILWLPKIFFNLIRYKLCIISREEIESKMNEFMGEFLNDKEDMLRSIDEFWEKNQKNLNEVTLKEVNPEDIILTASPSFLINGIKDKIIAKNIISSEIDLDKKQIVYLNFGENKVKKYKEAYGNLKIDGFYTDSYNDKDMMDISEKAFLVKKNKVIQIK